MIEIKGFDGYFVTENGEVWSRKSNKFLKPRKHTGGYLTVSPCIDGKTVEKYIHRLVAEGFLKNPKNFKQVNHKDHDKTNNNVKNLEWCSGSHNIREGVKKGKINNKKRGKIKRFTDKEIISIAERRAKGDKIVDIAKDFNVSRTSISSVCNGRSNKKLYDKYFKKFDLT